VKITKPLEVFWTFTFYIPWIKHLATTMAMLFFFSEKAQGESCVG
jgi:hypothetical protein